jgi:hypothetical protein
VTRSKREISDRPFEPFHQLSFVSNLSCTNPITFESTRMIRWFSLLLMCAIDLAATDTHLNANGPFGKAHAINDVPSPFACDRRYGSASTSRRRPVQSMNVSRSRYASNDVIEVSWTRVPNSCKDDFVGIYFTTIDDAAGKRDETRRDETRRAR